MDGTSIFVGVMVLAVVIMRVGMRRAIGMGMRMLVPVVGMRAVFVAMAMAVRRAIGVYVPVAIVLVILSLNGFALYARLADGTSTSGTHLFRSSSFLPCCLAAQ
jgi:hypothetical protein